MEVISGTKNIVTTECGHCFHTNCLMTSVAHNGFGCPYCRTQMAAAPEVDSDDDDDDDSAWGSYDEDDDEELYGDHALRGARWLFQRANGEEVDDEEDIQDEGEENRENLDIIVKPSVEFLVRKLVSQGVTMENMVQALLVDHDEYDNSAAGADFDGILFGKLRILISNYKPEDDAPKVDVASVDSFYENRFMRVN
jgi:hypothetical protein